MRNILQQKRGKVRIARNILTENANAAMLKEIFSNIFPIGTENDFSFRFYDNLFFLCLSEHFREVPDSEMTPEYDVTIKTNEDGSYEFKGVREIDFKGAYLLVEKGLKIV